MTLITKPDFTYVWASGGSIVAPNDTKKQLGWVAEAPPFQYDNWLQNRQDRMLAHINQRGIAAWDALTNYEAGSLSYVQGSDGKIYKSVAASGPSGSVQNPTTDAVDTYWTEAFAGLVSPLLTGAPTAPTAPRNDNSTKIANTKYIKDEGVQRSTLTSLTASTVLTSANSGAAVRVAGSGITITLPPVSTLLAGATILLLNDQNTAGFPITIKGWWGTETIRIGSTAAANTFVLLPGETADCVTDGVSWFVYGGTSNAYLSSLQSFKTTATSSGSQASPGGIIRQWGIFTASSTAGAATAVTFPTAFPTACWGVRCTPFTASTTLIGAWYDTPTVGGFNGHGSTGSLAVFWEALGN